MFESPTFHYNATFDSPFVNDSRYSLHWKKCGEYDPLPNDKLNHKPRKICITLLNYHTF